MIISKLIEMVVAERYANKYKRPFCTVHGFFKDYDISSISRDIQIEVKMDTYSNTSGNVAVEYTYKNEPSGVSASTADSFVFVIPEGKSLDLVAYEVDARDLRSVLSQMPLLRGGDGYHSTMKLLPVSLLKEIAIDKFPIDLNLKQLKEYWKK